MKLWTAAAFALTLAACTPPAETPAGPPQPEAIQAPSGEYTMDPNHSTLTVRALHFGLSYYTLRFRTLSGTLNFNAENPAQSSVAVTIDTTSIDTTYPGPRDFNAELQNSEWFDSATYPTATFTSTNVEVTGPNTGRVTGDLTIRGVTHPVTLDVTYNAGYAQHPMGMPVSLVGFSAHGTIKRSDYGLMVLQPNGGPGTGVADDVEVLIEAEFSRPIEQAPVTVTPAEPVN